MRHCEIIVATAIIIFFPCLALAQGTVDYPTKPVRVIVGSGPGGGSDLQTRLFAQKLSESLKHQFVVDNRPGASDTIANAAVAKSAPDGYTLLSLSPTFTFAPALRPNLPYDPVKDFVTISLVARSPYLLLVHPALPTKSVNELIALAKSKPGALDAGVTNGSALHLAAAYFASAANIKVTLITYKSTGQIIVDAIAGQVHMIFANVLATMPHVRSGRLRALGVSSAGRSPALPELPTIAESGVRGYDVTSWHGWMAPAGTPSAIVSKLSAELAKAVRSPEIAKKLVEEGGEPVGSTPEQFQQLIAVEIPRWRKVVTDSGMRVE